MSERLLKILLAELRTVRIACKGSYSDGTPCGAVLEVPAERLDRFFAGKACECRACGTSFAVFDKPGTGRDPFKPLAEALRDLEAVQDRAEVQFVIPDAG